MVNVCDNVRGTIYSNRKAQVSVCLELSDIRKVEKLCIVEKYGSLSEALREGLKLLLSLPDNLDAISRYDEAYGKEVS